MNLTNLAVAYIYCSNLVSNHGLIRLIRFISNLQANYAISFLFRLDLILHACAAHIRCDSLEILNFASKLGLNSSKQQDSL